MQYYADYGERNKIYAEPFIICFFDCRKHNLDCKQACDYGNDKAQRYAQAELRTGYLKGIRKPRFLIHNPFDERY